MATTQRVQSDNKHLQNATSAKWKYCPAGATTTVKATAGRLLRILLLTNGGSVLVRNGTEPMGTIASDSPEQTFNFGVYCNTSIVVEVGSTSEVLVAFD